MISVYHFENIFHPWLACQILGKVANFQLVIYRTDSTAPPSPVLIGLAQVIRWFTSKWMAWVKRWGCKGLWIAYCLLYLIIQCLVKQSRSNFALSKDGCQKARAIHFLDWSRMGCSQIFAKKVKGLFLAPGQTPLDPVIVGIISLANVSIASLTYALQRKGQQIQWRVNCFGHSTTTTLRECCKLGII